MNKDTKFNRLALIEIWPLFLIFHGGGIFSQVRGFESRRGANIFLPLFFYFCDFHKLSAETRLKGL